VRVVDMCEKSPREGKPKGAIGAPASGRCVLRRALAHSGCVDLNPHTHLQHTRWDPKDGELCLSRVKPGETLVEARSDADVQIAHLTWV
jgi:hypothetical protein